MAIPVIYKGDDTDFRGSTGFTLKVVTSSNLNLSGCAVEVEVLGFRRSFPASATGELVCPFAFTAAETQRMPLGIHAATVRVYDSKGRVRTINNSIRVKVTNSVHEAYGKDDPQEVTLAVSTVDLEAYAKKEEVTAAIEEAMKDASASVKLHAITPQVAATTDTLKPVDGAANYVAEPLTGMKKPAGGMEPYLVSLQIDPLLFSVRVPALGDKANYDVFVAFDFYGYAALDGIEYGSPHGGGIFATMFYFTVLQDIPGNLTEVFYTGTDEAGTVDGFPVAVGDTMLKIPAGTRFRLVRYGPDVTSNSAQEIVFREGAVHTYLESPPGTFSSPDGFVSLVSDISLEAFYAEFVSGHIRFCLTEWAPRSLRVTLPSTDATKARKFTLAVETDAGSEMAVEWQGGVVIEATPDATNLVPGLTVWDVAEVAPGKFKVGRASTPARSVPLTLTSPGGRVAELTVGDDLVLEVKEK